MDMRASLDEYIEEKLLHLHTAFLGIVKRVNNSNDIDVQPLTMTKQLGKEAKEQALLSGIPCIDSVWDYISVGTLVVCIVCERDITEARRGNSSVPSRGRHQMKDSIIIGTIGGTDQSATGAYVLDDPEDYSSDTVNKIFREAEKYIGMPYTFGGTPPKSFDCSAFVCWVFSNSGVYDLSRTTAQGIYSKCQKISANEAKAGDIVFFTGTYNAGRPVTHVGIYAGNNRMIHCGDPIQYTSIDTPYWQEHLYGFGRLI